MTGHSFHVLLGVTVALFVIVATAQLFGRIAPMLRQPAVVGEMAAGVVLGPSLLGAVAPDLSAHLFPTDVKQTLFVIAMLGLSFYMFLVGIEHEHEAGSRKEASFPVVMAIAGMVVPVTIGAAAAALVANRFRPADIAPGVFVVFVGGALSVTAFPMLARMLQERRMMGTPFGAVATRAAALDDAMAWCLLAVLSGFASGGTLSGLLHTILPAAAFAAIAFWLLPKLFRRPMQRAVDEGHVGDGLLGALLMLVLGAGWFSDYIGIYSVFGGFIAGMALPSVPGFSALINARLLQLVRCLFLPVFFAYSGLNTDITTISGSVLLILGLLLAAAFTSKTAAAVLVSRAYGWGWGKATAMGALMNARGLMILIFINIGLGLGIIEQRMFSILVVVAVITTALALPIYRRYYTPAREDAERQAAAAAAVEEIAAQPPDRPVRAGDMPN
ncbi:cation:proton antiporter [Tsukamurella sp. 8F]|uniref:cation:proton antiporter domain-containing protein n=1 Tax=unclassified Tsukamurella TaxID=2633480 RepID=UPI0023B9CC95|nr:MULTISPECIES: cation:proton antiporter [unclassified Tsukamurella]MDF0531682.1 cation:proton antiporter [Tsukamurella sp. 8J]MDF0588928.1 cation:proton antiporter [Tsukamurella sp. 8F]